MKKALILVLTNFFILTLILLGKPVKAQTTEITGQFLYGLQLYVLPEKQITPDYSTAIYSSTIDENDFITSGLYQNWLQPRLPDGINGYIYLVDSTHTIGNVYLGGGYLEQGQTLSYPYEPTIELKHYNAKLIDIFRLTPVNKYYYEAYGGRLDYIVYYDVNDGSKPRIKLIDATNNENDYNRVKLSIDGYDTGYNSGYSMGYENGQNSGYSTGYQDGQNNGYNAGYNAGQYDFYNEYYQQIYNDGYNAGLGDRQYGVNTIVNFNQLLSTQTYQNVEINGITFTPDNNGNILLNGTSTANILYHLGGGEQTGGQIFLCYGSPQESNIDNYYIYDNFNGNIVTNSGYIGNFRTSAGQIPLYIRVLEGVTLENVVFKPQLFNLTQIYGQGNEPSTIEQFKNDFPSSYYPYTTSQIINIDYENGYITGKNDGFAIGYDDGISYQATQQLTSDGWIKNIFTGIGSFLAIEIIPNVTIGLIVGLPFIISVAWFVIKMARGGGNT